MPTLITQPHFDFPQGDTFDGGEYPVKVIYYDGSISLEQNDNSICLHPDYIKALFKEIEKHKAEADKALNPKK